MRRALPVSLLLCVCAGCVERTMTIHTDPPGALVYMNDQEVGRSPLSKRFIWYGTYDVQVRKEGYQTLTKHTPVIAPWWQWVPIDLFAELLPVRLEDRHTISYQLKPLSGQQIDPEAIVNRGQKLREQLESSRIPQTQPATRPSKK